MMFAISGGMAGDGVVVGEGGCRGHGVVVFVGEHPGLTSLSCG